MSATQDASELHSLRVLDRTWRTSNRVQPRIDRSVRGVTPRGLRSWRIRLTISSTEERLMSNSLDVCILRSFAHKAIILVHYVAQYIICGVLFDGIPIEETGSGK